MSNYFEYLEKPCIPRHLIDSVYDYLQGPTLFLTETDSYKLFNVNDNLKTFIRSIFPFEHRTRLQLITNNLVIHTDTNRKIAYNYIIDQGGTQVKTCFYDENLTLVESHVIAAHRWHSLDVSKYHNVIDIERPRLSITVFVPLLEVPV